MTQILIIESDETLRKIIKLNLTKTLGSDVIEMSSSKEAIELLGILPEMDLIICREVIKKDSAGFNLAEYLKAAKLKTPLVIIGKRVSSYKYLFEV
jgi:DNA-binding NtrC family response regulator